MDGSLVLRKIGLLLGCWEKQAAATPWLTFWEGNLALWSFSINSHRVRISPPPDVCWRSDPSLGDAGGATGHKVSALSAFPSLSNKASLWAQCCVLGCLLWARAFPKQLGWSGVLEVLGELLERCCGLSSPVTASVCRGGNLWRLEFFIFIFIYFFLLPYWDPFKGVEENNASFLIPSYTLKYRVKKLIKKWTDGTKVSDTVNWYRFIYFGRARVHS